METFIPIINTVITALVSLAVAFGTWHVTMKQSRKKDTDALKQALTEHKKEIDIAFRDLQDEVTKVNSTVQTQIALIDTKLDTLSTRVEKHNNVIERTYKLEQETAVMAEQIKVANHRITDLEDK